MGHNSRTFSKDHKNAKSSKEGTKKNIKSSVNKLLTRNETLFGPPGRNYYNPNSRFMYGGDPSLPSIQSQSAMAKLTSRKNGGIAFPQQPTAGSTPGKQETEFYAPNWIPPGPIGFYEMGGFPVYPQQPTADFFFAGAPWAAHYAMGGGLYQARDGAFTPEQYKQAQTDSMTLYNAGLASKNMPSWQYKGANEAAARLTALNKQAPTPTKGEFYGNQPGYTGGYNVAFQKPSMKPYNPNMPTPLVQNKATSGSGAAGAPKEERKAIFPQGQTAYQSYQYPDPVAGYSKSTIKHFDPQSGREIDPSKSYNQKGVYTPSFIDKSTAIAVNKPGGSTTTMAYGGGLPSGANEMPCLECGGYMEMGGDNQFGGGVDGGMDYFKKGGHWIQEATKNMRTDKPCTGSKFGGPSCPPGSKRYNLAKTFRAMAKKAYGGANDTSLDPQGNYVDDMQNMFKRSIATNYGLAEADNLAQQFDSMAQNAAMQSTPMAAYGYNMGYDPYQGYNPQAINNYNMAQGMLDQMDAKKKSNSAGLLSGLTNFAGEYYNPNRNYVKWDLEKADPIANLPEDTGMAYGGMLPKAAFGVDAFGNPAPNQMGPLSLEETNQRTIDRAKSLPWNQRPDMQVPQAGPYNTNGWIPDPRYQKFPKYYEQQMPYWMSQNGQTRYDYGTPQAWYNVNQNSGNFGGNWNTPGWNTPNPFFNAMFGDPNMTTRLASITPERGMFGDLFNRSGVVRNPKKVTYRFNTYINPQTGKVETKPVQGPANKPAEEKGFMDQVAEEKKKARAANTAVPYAEEVKDTTPQPSAKQQQIMDYMKSQLTLPAGQQTDQPFNFQQASSQQLPGPRAEVMNTQETQPSARQQAIANYMQGQLTAPAQTQSDNYDFMSDVQNSQRPGPLAEQAYGGMPSYAFAYGGYLPMAAFGYNVYGQPDPNFAGPLSPQYEQTLMGPQPANQPQGGDPTGGYKLTGTRKKQGMSGQSIYGATMGILGGLENLALNPERAAMDDYMAKQTLSDSLNPAVGPYRGNTVQTGSAYGAQFGADSSSPGAYTKKGGMIYANGGAYETGVPVELTDDEIQAVMAAGGTVRYI